MTGPLALTDQQYLAVCQACEPMLPPDRDAFLRALAQLLQGEAEIGDGTVARAIRCSPTRVLAAAGERW